MFAPQHPESKKIMVPEIQCLVRTRFPIPVSSWGEGALWGCLYEDMNPIISWGSQESPNTIILGVRFQHADSWGDIESTALNCLCVESFCLCGVGCRLLGLGWQGCKEKMRECCLEQL